MHKNYWYKYCFYISTVLLIICIVYYVKTKSELNELQKSNNNKQYMLMSEHLLSFYMDELDGEAILASEYPVQLISEITNCLIRAETSFEHTFGEGFVSVSFFYNLYYSFLSSYKIEYIRTGTIEDKKTFVEVINDLSIIKEWLEDRYRNDNFSKYTVEELQEQIGSKLKHVNLDRL